MNPIGIVKSNIELMESTNTGDIMILKNRPVEFEYTP
jgi:hypothetical protein